MSKEYLEAFNEIIDKFAEQMVRANKEELIAINKTNAIEYLYRTPQVRLLQEALQRLKKYDDALSGERLTEFGSQLTVNSYKYGKEHKMYYAPEYVVKLYDKLRNVEDVYREVEKDD